MENIPPNLIEELAFEVHNAWLTGRKNDDWSFGERRNDQKKTNPDFVAYQNLSESEKDGDRRPVLAVLQALQEDGFQFVEGAEVTNEQLFALETIDDLANEVHKAWLKWRHDDGWTYGPVRDDEKKTHPDLVAYEKLPESEKEYDRRTVEAILNGLRSWGYNLVKESENE